MAQFSMTLIVSNDDVTRFIEAMSAIEEPPREGENTQAYAKRLVIRYFKRSVRRYEENIAQKNAVETVADIAID